MFNRRRERKRSAQKEYWMDEKSYPHEWSIHQLNEIIDLIVIAPSPQNFKSTNNMQKQLGL